MASPRGLDSTFSIWGTVISTGEDVAGGADGGPGEGYALRPPQCGALAASAPRRFASARWSISEAHRTVSPPPLTESLLWGLTEATERARVSDSVLQPSSGKSLLERRLMEGGLRSVQNKQRCPGCCLLADLPEASFSEQ